MTRHGEAKPARSMDELVAEMYSTLRELADRAIGRARGMSLDATDLVHECYLKLSKASEYAGLERVELSLREAEAPRLRVVARAVRNPVGAIRQRMEPRSQLIERHPRANRRAVAHDVQVVGSEVDDALAAFVPNPCVANVPLGRHCPVEHARSARHLVPFEREHPADHVEGLAYAVAGDAATDRMQFPDQRHHCGAVAGGRSAVSHRSGSSRTGGTPRRARRSPWVGAAIAPRAADRHSECRARLPRGRTLPSDRGRRSRPRAS